MTKEGRTTCRRHVICKLTSPNDTAMWPILTWNRGDKRTLRGVRGIGHLIFTPLFGFEFELRFCALSASQAISQTALAQGRFELPTCRSTNSEDQLYPGSSTGGSSPYRGIVCENSPTMCRPYPGDHDVRNNGKMYYCLLMLSPSTDLYIGLCV